MERCCRACLTPHENFTYFIHKNVNEDLYRFCTSIEVVRDDNITKALCDKCHTTLEHFNAFKQSCIENNNKLMKHDNDYTTDKPVLLKTEQFDVFNDQPNKFEHINEDKYKTIEQETKLSYKTEHNDIMDLKCNANVQLEEYSPRDYDEFISDFPLECQRKCEIIKRKRGRPKNPNKTIEVSSNNKPKKVYRFTCVQCNKKFVEPDSFEEHMLSHEGKTYTKRCEPCDKTFKTWCGLRKHRLSAHTRIGMDRLLCEQCGWVSRSRPALREHERRHHAHYSLVCDKCGKSFQNKQVLKTHLRTHEITRTKTHECQYCGIKYFSSEALCSHKARIHEGKRYICDLCSTTFNDKHSLTRHILKHMGKSKYKCSVCFKHFASLFNCNEHFRTHTGERPFVCTYCKKDFSSKRRLFEHELIHKGVKPHRCKFCVLAFRQRGSLKRHLINVHFKKDPTLRDSI